MFSNVNAILCGIYPAPRSEVLRAIIEKNGGTALEVKQAASIFKTRETEIDDSVTHIFVTHKAIKMETIRKILNAPNVPDIIPILDCNWISDCFRLQTVIAIEDYMLENRVLSISPINPPSVIFPPQSSILAADMTGDQKTSEVFAEEKASVPSMMNQFSFHNTDTRTDSKKRPSSELLSSDSSDWRCIYSSISSTEEPQSSHSSTPSALYRFNRRADSHYSSMVAFDLDGTLIKTKSGKMFGQDKNDWELFHHSIPTLLRRLYDEGNYLAIISNQNGVSKTHGLSLEELKYKLDAIINRLGVPIDVFCAFDKDCYRKPRTGAFNWLVEHRIHNPTSLRFTYIGDACGRPKSGTRPKDFSSSDYKFALNCNAQVFN